MGFLMEIIMLKVKRLEMQLNKMQKDYEDLNSQVGVLKLTIAMLEEKIEEITEPKKELKKRGRKPKVELPKEELKKSVRKVSKKEK